MEDLIIKETQDLPVIEFYTSKGLLTIKGRSIANDPESFYSLLFENIEEYKKSPQPQTIVNLKIEYFNTTSSKFILKLLKNLKLIISDTNTLVINWICDEDDEEMFEAGEDLSVLTGMPFNYESVSL